MVNAMIPTFRPGLAAALLLTAAPAFAQAASNPATQPSPMEIIAEAVRKADEAKANPPADAEPAKSRQMVLGGRSSVAPARTKMPSVASAPAYSVALAVTFLKGSATLTTEATRLLDEFSASLRDHVFRKPLTLSGHTDNAGPAVTNIRLSQARAAAVADYLKKAGVKADIAARGYGFSKPLPGKAPSDPANRRVELSI